VNNIPEKIVPLQAWHIVMSVKLHFEGKLDAVKYRFRMSSLTQKALDARKDRYHIEKLARKYSTADEAIWFVTSNILAGNKWIGDMNEGPYTEFRAWHESMEYRFTQEIKSLAEKDRSIDNLLVSSNGKPPRLLQSYAAEKTSIHTIALIECLTSFLTNEMIKVDDPLGMWEDHARLVRSYAALLGRNLHKPTYSKIVISQFTE
jgi:hypothetical protein